MKLIEKVNSYSVFDGNSSFSTLQLFGCTRVGVSRVRGGGWEGHARDSRTKGKGQRTCPLSSVVLAAVAGIRFDKAVKR